MTDTVQALIPPDIQAMNNNELIAEHRKIAEHLALQQKAFNEFCAPHKTRQEFIENRLFSTLVQLNAGKPEGKRASISTDAGTAYLSTIVTPKIVNRESYLDWVLDNWATYGGMLQLGAPQKEAFNEYVDEHGKPPPHTEISTFTRVNIRKA